MNKSPYDKYGRHKNSCWFIGDIPGGVLVECGHCKDPTEWLENDVCLCCGLPLIYPNGASW